MNKQLMTSIIDAAKKQLNLGNSELSLKLGHHRNYINRVLHQENPTPEQITKVVDKVKALVFEQKESLPEFNPIIIADAKMVSLKELNDLHQTIASQKKELDHKNQVLDKRNDLYRKLELECKDKDEAIKIQLENVASKILVINELELQLKTTQEKFAYVAGQKDKKISKLQNDCNHATNQYQGKRAQVVRLNEKLNKQTIIYLIIIVIISLIGIMDFAS